MNRQTFPESPRMFSAAEIMTWATLGIALAPYLLSLFFAFLEIGDPPDAGNDWLQLLLLAAWLLLFAGAIVAAWLTKDWAVGVFVTMLCFFLTLVGLFLAGVFSYL